MPRSHNERIAAMASRNERVEMNPLQPHSMFHGSYRGGGQVITQVKDKLDLNTSSFRRSAMRNTTAVAGQVGICTKAALWKERYRP
jgi:hypothetical protein